MSSGRLSHAFAQSRSGDVQEKRTRKGKNQVHEVVAIAPPEPTATELDESALRQFDLDPKVGFLPLLGVAVPAPAACALQARPFRCET